MPHGSHIYSKASYMEKATMCEYPQYDHALSHQKCVLRFCAKLPCINLPDQETYNQYSDTTPSIRFHIYHIISCYIYHDLFPLKNNKICRMCKQVSSSDKSTKIYTRKELAMMGKTIFDSRTSFYIPSIKKVGLSPTTCAHTWYKSLW